MYKEEDITNLINHCLEHGIAEIKEGRLTVKERKIEKITKEWATEWNSLFPTAKDTYDRSSKRDPVGGKYGVYTKLRDFVLEFDYTLDQIIEATKAYIKDEEANQFRYTKRSGFFISKRPEPSRLAAECEKYLSDDKRMSKLDNLFYGE